MVKVKAILFRLEDKGNQTLGTLTIYDGIKKVFSCVTLEPAWRDNKNFISCISKGKYRCEPRFSAKYGHHWHIVDVEGRSLILIHFGNFRKDTKGCVLVGKKFIDIDRDGNKDITSSVKTMKRLNSVLGKSSFKIYVTG